MSEAEGTQSASKQARPITHRALPISGCHVCTSHAPDDDGYPAINRGRRVVRIIRHLYEQLRGPIPAGLVVRHTCDRPSCINVEHAVLGTHADNVADRVRRKRSARGEHNGRAKLDERKVRVIKRSKQRPAALAKKYGVSLRSVTLILEGRNWAWVGADAEPTLPF